MIRSPLPPQGVAGSSIEAVTETALAPSDRWPAGQRRDPRPAVPVAARAAEILKNNTNGCFRVAGLHSNVQIAGHAAGIAHNDRPRGLRGQRGRDLGPEPSEAARGDLGVELGDDGERFALDTGKVLAWERTLDFRTGLLERTVEWETATGKRVRIASRRLVSLARKHVAAIEYAVTPLNFSGGVRIVADIDADVTNLQAGDDPRVGSALTGASLIETQREVGSEPGAHGVLLLQRTRHSGFTLATATDAVPSSAASRACPSTRPSSRAPPTACAPCS